MADLPDVEYEQLLEMISAFQWLPDGNRLRVALDRERDNGPGNPLFGCLHHYAAAIKRMTDREELLISSKISEHMLYSAHERIRWA